MIRLLNFPTLRVLFCILLCSACCAQRIVEVTTFPFPNGSPIETLTLEFSSHTLEYNTWIDMTMAATVSTPLNNLSITLDFSVDGLLVARTGLIDLCAVFRIISLCPVVSGELLLPFPFYVPLVYVSSTFVVELSLYHFKNEPDSKSTVKIGGLATQWRYIGAEDPDSYQQDVLYDGSSREIWPMGCSTVHKKFVEEKGSAMMAAIQSALCKAKPKTEGVLKRTEESNRVLSVVTSLLPLPWWT